FAVWNDSNHAYAWRTLLADEAHVDPACQLCHTTGYGLPGGFESLAKNAARHAGGGGWVSEYGDNIRFEKAQRAARTAVGCESCHGPSQAHVDRPKQRTPFIAREQC